MQRKRSDLPRSKSRWLFELPNRVPIGYIILRSVTGRKNMRAFLAALVAAAIIAVVGAFVLDKIQEPVSEAYSTQGVRL
jgi:hypothetical protein